MAIHDYQKEILRVKHKKKTNRKKNKEEMKVWKYYADKIKGRLLSPTSLKISFGGFISTQNVFVFILVTLKLSYKAKFLEPILI